MFGFTTTRRLRAELDKQQRGFKAAMRQTAIDDSGARQILARELSDLKEEIALHIIAAEHPSSALSDARSMALSLREACEARGIDLRIELGRLDGRPL